jgi:hypothetical protein
LIVKHFFQLESNEVYIKERFNDQEPIWYLDLPYKISKGSPFGSEGTDINQEYIELIKYIAESITPAGVSVFVGFYSEWNLGNFDDFEDMIILPPRLQTSIEHDYALLGCPRWDFYNGWTEATIDFEDGNIPMDQIGDLEVINANDQNRHVLRLGVGASVGTGITGGTGLVCSGFFELWEHPQDNVIRMGVKNSGNWLSYVEYDTDGFYDHYGNLLTLASSNCDYHVKVKYEHSSATGSSGLCDFYINRELLRENVSFLINSRPDEICVQSLGSGDGFIDALGLYDDANYVENDNWQRLYPFGWGRSHVDELSGETSLLEKYFRRDRFFVI